jgi:putative ABC transport system permease protein
MSLPLSELTRLTWRSLTSDWTRSGLTTLGVFMGVAAVSATLNVQSITSQQIATKLAERDKPYVIPYISPKDGFGEFPMLDASDIKSLKQAIPVIRSVSVVGNVFGIRSLQFEGQQAENVDVRSVSLNYLSTTGRKMLAGRFFDQGDFDQYRPVAIVDEKLMETLFQGENPIKKAIYASGNRLIVVGVTQTKSEGYEDKSDGSLWVTSSYSTTIQGGYNFTSLQVSPYRLEQMKVLKDKIEKVLLQRYPNSDVYLSDNAEDLLKEKETQEISARALTAIGLIALAIGGVGIANITIATVMERTKEIGIRRAIGATRFEVMLQFILEALLLSCIGGGLAIVIVHGLTEVATTVVFELPYEFSIYNASLSMGAAISVGVGASFFPALRATRIDIIKALRSD